MSSPTRYTIHGNPVPAPRMTKRDRWAKRPCVLRYREFCDRARAAHGMATKLTLSAPTSLLLWVYLPIPKTRLRGRYAVVPGSPCTSKPDADNLWKAVSDALFENDEWIWAGSCLKYWDDGKGPRVEVEIHR